MTDTALVETLTAEVKALVIGSRQITLSVARQLDYVESLDAIEIFGRVRIKPGENTVIGRQRETGALVLAVYGSVPRKFTLYLNRDDDVNLQIPKCIGYRAGTSYRAGWADDSIEVDSDAITRVACGQGHQFTTSCGCRVTFGVTHEWVSELFIERRRRFMLTEALNEAAARSDLIVLAGLK